MALIGANGLVLVPCAIFLAGRARADAFDGIFYGAQALELVAGALNGVDGRQYPRSRWRPQGAAHWHEPGPCRPLPSGRAASPHTTTAAPSSIAVQLASTAA